MQKVASEHQGAFPPRARLKRVLIGVLYWVLIVPLILRLAGWVVLKPAFLLSDMDEVPLSDQGLWFWSLNLLAFIIGAWTSWIGWRWVRRRAGQSA